MAVCDVQVLMDEAPCFNTQAPGQRDVLVLVLLCRILQTLDPMASCDLQTLFDEANCFFTLAPGQREVIELQLLCNIQALLEAALPQCGSGSPEGVVTGHRCGQTYLDVDTCTTYHFNGVVGANTGWC